jgi:predicted transcriptional regulator
MVASELSKIIDRFSVIIVDRKSERDNINSTAVISTDELQRMDGTDALTDLVASRGTRK